MDDQTTLVRIGIQGLDDILLGGIPRSNIILIEGGPGTGKTLAGTEFIYRGITEFNEPGLIIVFETNPEKLIRDGSSLGWDLRTLLAQKKLKIVFTSPRAFVHELHSPDSVLLEAALEIGAKRIFIDGVGLLRSFLNDTDSGGNGTITYRESIFKLIEWLTRENLTAMLSSEIGQSLESHNTVEVAEFLVDTVILLKRALVRRSIHRQIEIIKSRGQDFEGGEHTLQITNHGLRVFRRVQSPRVSATYKQPSSTARRSAIGVEALDTMLGGGIFDGSTTMVIGVSGAGKTVLATQVLLEGAQKLGHPGLLVSLDEHPAQIVRNSETIGLPLQEQIDAGAIHMLFESPQELSIDIHFARIVEMIERHNIKRMVIDGMTSYSTALGNQTIYRDFFHALVAFTKHRLMNTFFNYENPEFLGISSFMPDFPVSSIVDNTILLSLVEINSSLRRCLTVVKARGSRHEFDSREYRIGKGGISLVPLEGSVAPARSLVNHSSLLSRAPSRFALPVISQRKAKFKANGK